MKYYILAGEASGDLHGSNLMKANQDNPKGYYENNFVYEKGILENVHRMNKNILQQDVHTV